MSLKAHYDSNKKRKKIEEPKENPVKQCLFIRGSKTNEVVNQVLRDLASMKKPHSISFSRKNELWPFEDATSFEFFSKRNDCSLFVFGNHSKKRPNNIVLGRCYDFQILDMIEVGITDFKPIDSFKEIKKSAISSKPLFIFEGIEFENSEKHKKLANLLIDMFRGRVFEEIDLTSIDHVIVCTAQEDKVFFRHYTILLKKSGTKLPRVELKEMGPRFDMTFRRTRFGDIQLQKDALKKPKELNPKKQKNFKSNIFGEKHAKIHMPRQEYDKIATKKMKGLKRKRGDDGGESKQGGDSAKKQLTAATASIEE